MNIRLKIEDSNESIECSWNQFRVIYARQEVIIPCYIYKKNSRQKIWRTKRIANDLKDGSVKFTADRTGSSFTRGPCELKQDKFRTIRQRSLEKTLFKVCIHNFMRSPSRTNDWNFWLKMEGTWPGNKTTRLHFTIVQCHRLNNRTLFVRLGQNLMEWGVSRTERWIS